MTLFDLIYFIGCGVAFLMCLVGFYRLDIEEEKCFICFICIIFSAFVCSVLSWSIPIWWIGTQIYLKYREKSR